MQQIKVIMVEDDDILLRNIAGCLLLDGFDVQTATTAAGLMERVETDRFDAAVVDIGLPDRSGFEVVRYLKKNTAMGIIVLTAKETINDKIKGYDAGADLYFVKPVDTRELTAALNNLVRRTGGVPVPTGKWAFNASERILISPEDQKIQLTTKELIFVHALTRARGQTVSRGILAGLLEYSHDPIQANRAIDVLVARLRKKIRTCTHTPFPLVTIHAVGFRLTI